MITVKKFSLDDTTLWNDFNSSAKNATFLTNRSFMDYHSDKFKDHSLLIFGDDKLLALFPANESNKIIQSHGGLTYGGVILGRDARLKEVLGIFHTIFSYYQSKGYSQVEYRQIPRFLTTYFSHEEEYVFSLVKVQLTRCDTGFVLPFKKPIEIQKRRKRALKKANKSGVKVELVSMFDEFWNNVLTPLLKEKYNREPIHSVEEISLLASRFPENIVQCNAVYNDKIVAGITLFITRDVIHTQYIASSDVGTEVAALDAIVNHLITTYQETHEYLSLGTTNGINGEKLNLGLVEWKEGFGARTYPYKTYSIDLAKVNVLSVYE